MSRPSRPPSSLRLERLPDLPGGAEIWRRLGHEAGNPFATWEWAATWWRHFGAGREQRILGLRDGEGELVGVLPLYLAARRPLRTLRQVGHGPADQLNPVCAPRHREVVARAVEPALAESGGWDICVLERLGSDEGWAETLSGTVTRVESSPTIRIATTDWDEYLATKSPNYRSQARRLERRLAREHALEYRVAGDPERIGEDMDAFFALHETRWAETGSTAFGGGLRDFHRELATLALEGDWLRLCFLELDGTPRAANYCFRLGGADWFYQSGRDPRFEKDRIGGVLLNNSVREAVQDGMREFKLLLGTHAYKDRFANDDAPVVTVALGRNAAVAAALRGAVAVRRRARQLRRSG
jgi:CelD/BcsL family acetyltransferase involved in cellulose biosynthesis